MNTAQKTLGMLGGAASSYFFVLLVIKSEGLVDKSWGYVLTFLGVAFFFYLLQTLLED